MRKRNISIPIRVTEKELSVIDKKAARARLTRTEYLITCAPWQGDHLNRGFEADFSRFEASW